MNKFLKLVTRETSQFSMLPNTDKRVEEVGGLPSECGGLPVHSEGEVLQAYTFFIIARMLTLRMTKGPFGYMAS